VRKKADNRKRCRGSVRRASNLLIQDPGGDLKRGEVAAGVKVSYYPQTYQPYPCHLATKAAPGTVIAIAIETATGIETEIETESGGGGGTADQCRGRGIGIGVEGTREMGETLPETREEETENFELSPCRS
jgi:hypothetical protein